MQINGRIAAVLKFEFGARSHIVSASVLARIINDKVNDFSGSLEVNDIQLFGKFAKPGEDIGGQKIERKTADECIMSDKNVFVLMNKLKVELLCADSSHATMRELYRISRVIEELDRFIVNSVGNCNIFVNEHIHGGLTQTYTQNDEINYSFIEFIDETVNGKRSFSSFSDELNRFEYGSYGLSSTTRGILRMLKYDYRHHHIHIKEDCDNAHVTLTIPEGKSAKDTEVTRLYKIFRNYVFCQENPTFELNVLGTLEHTSRQLWEDDRNFKVNET